MARLPKVLCARCGHNRIMHDEGDAPHCHEGTCKCTSFADKVGTCPHCEGTVVAQTELLIPRWIMQTIAPGALISNERITYHCLSCGIVYKFPSKRKAAKRAS